MRKMSWFVVAVVLVLACEASAQVDTAWVRTYAGIIPGELAPTVLAPGPDGGVYVVGWISRPDNHHDFLFQRYDSTGLLLWERYHTGTGQLYKEDLPTDAVSDASGNLYVCGTVTNTPNDWDAAILKYSPNGTLLWHDHFDYPDFPTMETPNLIRVTKEGDVYVVGGVLYGHAQIGHWMLRKYKPDGILEWSLVSPWPGSAITLARGFELDAHGNTYFTLMNAWRGVPAGMSVVSYDPLGQFRWRVSFGEDMEVFPATEGLTLGDDNQIFASGYFDDFAGGAGTLSASMSSSGKLNWTHRADHLGGLFQTNRAIQRQGDGCCALGITFGDFQAIGIDANGSKRWEHSFGSQWDRWDGLTSSCVDADGRIIETGTFFPTSGRIAVKTIMLSDSGTVVWESSFPEGGTTNTSVTDISPSSNGTYYLAGAKSGIPGQMYVARFRTSERIELDILPSSCPNIINTGAIDLDYHSIHPGAAAANRPSVTVAILGTKTLDVNRVDPSTIAIVGLSPLSHRLMDVSRPLEGRESECECTAAGADGYSDLVLYFDQEQFVAALGPVNDGEVRALALTGKTKTGVPLSGSDCVTIKEGPTRISPLASAGEKTESGFAAYPNPFNAATVVSFSLATESEVRLDVYDVLGRRVATLIDDMMPAGEHQLSWDAAGLASGVYFARLATSAGMLTRKMVLVR